MSNEPKDNPQPDTIADQQHEFNHHASKLIKTSRPMLALMFVVLIIGVILILDAWKLGPFQGSVEATDNSYVHGKITILSSQINGYIRDVTVNDFDDVKKGQILMHIDTANYAQQVTESESNVIQAQNTLANQKQAIEQSKADVLAAQAKLEQAKVAYDLARDQNQRYQQLKNTGGASAYEITSAASNMKTNYATYKEAASNVLVAQEALKTAEVAEVGLKAQVESAQAKLKQAKITQQYSIIYAPIDGQLGQVSPRIGQYVTTGTQLFTIVPKHTWVIANFKETQMTNMKIGQSAWFTVDALNGQKFMATIDRIAPATGSQFSVIKPDNATGNFTKVVQRISIRLQIKPHQEKIDQLRPGMSVEAFVDTAS